MGTLLLKSIFIVWCVSKIEKFEKRMARFNKKRHKIDKENAIAIRETDYVIE